MMERTEQGTSLHFIHWKGIWDHFIISYLPLEHPRGHFSEGPSGPPKKVYALMQVLQITTVLHNIKLFEWKTNVKSFFIEVSWHFIQSLKCHIMAHHHWNNVIRCLIQPCRYSRLVNSSKLLSACSMNWRYCMATFHLGILKQWNAIM